MRAPSPSLPLSAALLACAPAAASADDPAQCHGHSPMESVSTFLGATLQYSTADRICCHNHHFAEYAGYLAAPEVDLFGRLDPEAETVFYDSVCGIPLFVAPRGRTFEEFKEESLAHGWPSFRPEEIVSENVIIHDDGRMESRCLTHLGHNLPDGRDRYCIDLVCVAGAPLSPGDAQFEILARLDGAALHGEDFNATAYESSAESFSGKYTQFPTRFVVIVAAVVGALAVYWCGIRPVLERRQVEREVGGDDEKRTEDGQEKYGSVENSAVGATGGDSRVSIY